MMDTHLHCWLTGLVTADTMPATVMVLSAHAPDDAAETLRGALDAMDPGSLTDTPLPGATRILAGVPAGTQPRIADEFVGALLPGYDLEFGDGFQLRIRNYGVADFESLDSPTALVVCDDDDFSDYLRDADQAWYTGRFASHLTHPAASIANLAGLGGPVAAAGPRHRLYVDEDGVVRTSPWGRGLGTYDESVDVLQERWARCNAASAIGDASCLETAVPESDRIDALVERPFIGRYVAVLHALRGLRAHGRTAHHVSGFGGRLASGTDAQIDAVEAPVLARFGSIFRAIDPQSGTYVDLGIDQIRALELLLDGALSSVDAQLDGILRMLMTHGVSRDWCQAIRLAPALTAVA